MDKEGAADCDSDDTSCYGDRIGHDSLLSLSTREPKCVIEHNDGVMRNEKRETERREPERDSLIIGVSTKKLSKSDLLDLECMGF
jgi:hypothetical protein